HRFRIDPSHYPDIFAALPAPAPHDEAQADSQAVFASVLAALGRLPGRDVPDDASRRARSRDSAVYKQNLARLARKYEWIADWINACLTRLNGRAGEPGSFDALDQLLARQAYRLADWRVAS